MNSRRSISGVSRTISEVGETSSNNDRLLRHADKYGTEIAEIIDPKIEYENFKTNGLKILELEVIYKRKMFERRNKFIKCIKEEEIQCLGNDTFTLELIGKSIVDKQRKDYSFCHLGLITIAIK